MDLPNTVFPYQKSNCTFSFAIEQTRNSAFRRDERSGELDAVALDRGEARESFRSSN